MVSVVCILHEPITAQGRKVIFLRNDDSRDRALIIYIELFTYGWWGQLTLPGVQVVEQHVNDGGRLLRSGRNQVRRHRVQRPRRHKSEHRQIKDDIFLINCTQ